VVFPSDDAAVAVSLWIAATHAIPAWQHATRLVINSPAKRCGKSRLLDIIAATCHRPLMSVSATVAAIYRSLGGDAPPTLIIDEADTIWGTKKQAEQNEDLRALINAGFQRGRPALRCEGPSLTPRAFPTFAMAALAGIGNMPDTITDRAVNIELRRRMSGEKVAQYRQRRDGPHLEQLRAELAAWAGTVVDALADAIPAMPVEDRAADTWEPLVAVADAAGGDWPARARHACTVLTARADETDGTASLDLKLLADIRCVFGDFNSIVFMSSANLVGELRKIEESPWADYDLNARKLAQRLKQFGVTSTRDAAGDVRGYRLRDLQDAFLRYLVSEPSVASETAPELRLPSDTEKPSDASIRQTDSSVRRVTTGQASNLTVLTVLTDTPKETCAALRCADCGTELQTDLSRTAGRCAECRLANPQIARTTRDLPSCHPASDLHVSSAILGQDGKDGRLADSPRARHASDSTPVHPIRTAVAFLAAYLTAHAGPDGWVPVSQVYAAALAAGYSRDAIKAARLKSTNPRFESTNTGRTSMWRIAPHNEHTGDDTDTSKQGDKTA
jgi:hypothetical protein